MCIENGIGRGFVGERNTIRRWIIGSLGESLLPTALGLFVALLALVFYRYLSARLNEFNVEMQNASLDLVNQLSRISRSTNT
jgi:biopolymer transport protein ExbB/TolQ